MEHIDETPVHRLIGAAGLPLDRMLDYARQMTSGPETARGKVMGSPGYMSPEQATGEAVDVRTDVFSLGTLTGHELLTMKLSGHKTCRGFDRYNVVSCWGTIRVGFGTPVGTLALVAVSGDANPQTRNSTHGEVAERLKAAVC